MSDYPPEIAALYDSVPVYASRQDVQLYVDEARSSGGNVLEVGCGTGRILSGRRLEGDDRRRPSGVELAQRAMAMM
jgi:hypothetical protein